MWWSTLLLAGVLVLLTVPSQGLSRPAVRHSAIGITPLASKRGVVRDESRDIRVSVSTAGALIAGGITAAALFGLFSRPTYNTAADIRPEVLASKQTIDGVVLKVIDGDTYRVRHVPWPFSSSKVTGPLGENTIVVRVYAIDTPETAKFGMPAQEYANASKDFAKKRLLNKKIKVQCLSRDQYGRIIGKVTYDRRDISEDLLSEGLAVVYRQGGAQYGAGDSISKWDRIEERAQKARKNIWKNGPNVELPSDYKKAEKKVGTGNSSQRVKFTRTGKNADAYIK